ncbi:HlyD family efflux transporter periplasmic adaptor subunit [Pseudomonas sp. MAG002Y]|uniref:HlyD family efflux transporter periplasmic adaptor subunit n=1 Tax=Pseudomonas sp. MAG002Y TaxID=2678690 RepID=UPI001C60CE89|nr:HlyD family efflux transporter periplasmic adaptor subunit [Pseudomonas sp. MAG002Y]MBW5415827.1 HlyD family efflux transporter periplasmic adaptor subunit [Pseudomonas sp. MAG002Y]
MTIQVQASPPMPGETEKAYNAALQLLMFEAQVRQQKSEQELFFHLANATQELVPYGQAVVLKRTRTRRPLRLNLISGLPVTDRHTPFARAVEDLIGQYDKAGRLDHAETFPLPAGHEQALSGLVDFPLRHAVWTPLADRNGRLMAGVLYLRATPFTEREQGLLKRMGETNGHAWRAFCKRRSVLDSLPLSRRTLAIAAALSIGISCIPVRLSVMAPVEVTASNPFVLTSPINGVIKSILVAPNTTVQLDQPLVQFEDIQPRNEMVLAQQQLAVAQAKDSKTSAAAFTDRTATHEMAITRAEHELAQLSYNYSLEVLQRTLIRSPLKGLAVYTDRRDWEGRSVMIGEEILQVADPTHVSYRIDLATGNAISLKPGSPVGVYLENVPLGGLKGSLQSISYTPHTTAAGTTSYTLTAVPDDGATPTIGARGTARVYGEYAPLIYQLLRRPIAAVRQFVGF